MPKTIKPPKVVVPDGKMEFVSLHHHTTFSNGDGHGSPLEHAQRADELNMWALGFTEHGNNSSHAAAEQACNKYGIKPIFGIEAYGSPAIRETKYKRKTHQTILAMDQDGYHSLNRLVTQSYKDFYQFPTVSWENLRENNKGLIVTSGCASSLTSCKLLGGKFFGEERDSYSENDFEAMLKVIKMYKRVFGDRYYLEVQRFPDLPRVCMINQALEEASKLTGVPLLATADVHYCQPHEGFIQQALHAAHRGDSVAGIGETWEYDIPLTFPESDEEILDDLISTGLSERSARSAIANTSVVAERCTVVLPKSKPLVFPIPDYFDGTREEYLDEQIAAGIEYRAAYGKICDGPEYQERIKMELEVMKLKPEFIDYFLFLSDLICWAKDTGIVVGPGRGSAAASLVCYLLRITEVDPITVPTMVFERFMDASRTDPPDIDIDIADEDRWKLVTYLKEHYGYANVGNVANIIRYRGKSALDKVGIIYRIPNAVLKPLKERISDRVETDERVDDSVADALATYSDDPGVAFLLEHHAEAMRVACEIEGDVQTFGTHAAGYVVSSPDAPIPLTCALYEKTVGTGSKAKQSITIPYDKRDAEYLGMMKADLLGLATCGMIDRALASVNELWRKRTRQSGIHLDMNQIYMMDLNDQDILKGFREDDLTGIFQFEGGTTRGVCRRVQPDSILDLSDINALSRPGPLFSGAVDRYIDAKHGVADVESVHELYDQHVESTYGQLVYQEQIMKVLRDLAGFDTVKVLKVRKIIGKKLGEFQFAELWEDFRKGCNGNGIDDDTAWQVWSSITTAAGYAFNIAHSYSYSVIAYWSMYLKKNFPEEFFAASLAKNGDGKDNIPRRTALLKNTKEFGRNIEVLQLDPMLARQSWRVVELDDGIPKLAPGFSQVPGIGDTTAQALETARDGLIRDFDSDEQWIDWEILGEVTKGVGPKTLETIKSFAAHHDPFGVQRTEKQLNGFREELARGDYDGAIDLDPDEFYTSEELASVDDWEVVAWVGLVANIVHRDAVEYERTKTGKSVEQILEEMEDPHLTKHAVLFAYDEFDEVAIRFGRKVFPKWSEMIDGLKEDHHIIAVVGKKMPGMGNSLLPQQVWVLNPDE